jgi:hypothetical protein
MVSKTHYSKNVKACILIRFNNGQGWDILSHAFAKSGDIVSIAPSEDHNIQ